MNWSTMQLKAINETGKNILVSAGAGSGKTSVLTARVISLLKKGIKIDELLILTFTNAASKEMKDRIRKAILKEDTLQEQIARLDEAFICTFDSFALFLVKKYHTMLNLPDNPKITDDTLIDILRKKCMRAVFDEFYLKNDTYFLELIDVFCVKDDELLLNEFLNIALKLDLKIDLETYLNNYVTDYYTISYFEEMFKKYEKIVLNKISELKSIIKDISYIADKDYNNKLNETFVNLFNAQTYEEIYLLKSITLPKLPKNSSDELKNVKESLSNSLKELKDLLKFGSKKDLMEDYFATKKYTTVLVKILKRYFEIYEMEKKKLGYFDFNTIFKIAYNLVKNNKSILEELKNQFKEIMIDEYQDTNDFQEAFINLIANNNVYMVGDIKQSIYRFRNANPALFKEKYSLYKNEIGGLKIDLIDNFRSRKEVLTNINLLFNPLMDEFLGGANYREEHQMVFGNNIYEELQDVIDYNMEIVNYDFNDEYLNEEIEAFYIANDIKKRVARQDKIVDKQGLRDIKYADFCILMDRSSDFLLYQKIFNYLGIPIHANYDEPIKSSIHFQTLKNIFILITKIVTNEYDDDFKFAFVSLARGFLFSLTDEQIYYILEDKKWRDSIVIKTFEPILESLNAKSLTVILEEILEKTNYYEKLISLGNISEGMVLAQYFKKLVWECDNFGYTYEDFVSYLNNLVDYQLEMKLRAKKKHDDCVKLMTIHASKGLEFPICYFAGLAKKFNISDIKEHFLYSKKFGLISSIYKEGIYATFMKELVKNDFYDEEISEKIRLFYVALTRAKEKMIFLLPKIKNDKVVFNTSSLISSFKRIKARSFADFLYLLKNYYKPYVKQIHDLKMSKDYLIFKVKKIKEVNGESILVEELEKQNTYDEQKSFAKNTNNLYTKKEMANMKLGTMFHETLQYLDFKKPRLDLINNNFIKNKLEAFLNSELIKSNLEFDFYHEYEFISKEDGELLHGIIDLLIVKDREVIIIDYKLQDVSNNEYLKQLKGYKDYVIKAFKKPVKTYLYSILNETFNVLDI